MAAHISDRITDQVIESLSASYRALIGECEIRTRSSTPDVLRPSAGSTSSGGGSVIGVSTGGMSLSITIDTPLTERTSLVIDGEEEEEEEEDEEESCSTQRVENLLENDNHVLLSKSIGRLAAEEESPMVSAFLTIFNLKQLPFAIKDKRNKRKKT